MTLLSLAIDSKTTDQRLLRIAANSRVSQNGQWYRDGYLTIKIEHVQRQKGLLG